MSAFVASCPLCNWHQKCKGVWDAHWQTRRHFQSFHPAEYTEILCIESEAHDILNKARHKYGLAVSRKF